MSGFSTSTVRLDHFENHCILSQGFGIINYGKQKRRESDINYLYIKKRVILKYRFCCGDHLLLLFATTRSVVKSVKVPVVEVAKRTN